MLHLKTNPTLTYEKALSERNESFAVSEAPNHLSFQSEYDIDNHKLKNVEDIQLLVKSESKTAEIAEVLFFVNGSFGRRVVVPVSSNDVNLTDVATSLITSASRDTNKKFVGELWVNRTVTSEPDVEEVVMVGDIPRAAEPTQESSVQMNTAVQVVPQPVPPITPAQQAIVLARSALVSQKPLLAVRPAIATASTAVIVQSQPLVVSAGGQMVVSTHQPIVSTSIGSLFQVTPGDFIVQNVQPKVIPTPETAKASEDNKTMSNGVKDSNGVAKPADQYPLIEVVFAHCSHCGSNSKDLKVCIYCRKPLPKDAKLTKMYQHSMNAPPAKAPEKAESRPKRKCTRKRKVEEPVTLSLISSDEEDGENSREKPPVAPTPPQLSVNDKEPIITEDTLSPLHNERIEGGGMELNDIMKKPDIERAMVNCRSVRIGSYKVTPKERIVLTEYGIYLDAPSLETKEWVTVSVMKNEIIKVLVNFGKSCPVLFFYITARGAAQVRKALGMTPGGNPYFDPTSNIEPYRRITLLPDKVSEETRLFIKGTYDKQCLLETLGEKEVDTILVKASPTSDSIVNAPMMTPSRGDISSNFGVQTPTPSGLSTGGPQMGNPSAGNAAQSLVRKIMVYPPPPAKGGIPINTEDYACLGEDNFLNDIIIDFYLKYFVATHLSPEDQKRTHVFSSFFYKRLTTKDPNPNPNDKRTAAERRHHRVRSWTKQVDLFSKDFIIIPINENSHWFLGVICFPGLTQAVRMVDNKPVPNPSRRIGNVPHMIGGTTITRVNQEPMTITLEPDEEDRDEADAEDDDLEPNTSDEEPCEEPEGGSELLDDATHPVPKVKVKKEPLDPIKQPCILIFDSLVGASRSKVCATLREYIQVEYNVRHKDTKGKRDINPVTFKATVVKVPQQTNYTDCGLYVLQYVEAFFQNPIMDYRMPIKQLVDWFDTTIVSKKRYQIQQLLHKIMEEQNIDISRLNLPLLNLHPDGTGKSFTTEDEDDDMGEEMGMDDYDDMGEEEEIGEDDEEMQNMEFQRPSNVANASRSQPPTPTPSQIPSPQQPEEIRSRLVRKDISITSSIASSIGSSISISSSPVSTSPAKTVPLVPQSISVTRKVVSISSPGKLPSSPAKLDPSAISITSSTGVKRKIVSPVTNLKDIRNPRLAQPGTLSRSVEIKKIRPE